MSLTKTSPPSALRPLLGALAASALLAACGGGGGGDSASSDTGTTRLRRPISRWPAWPPRACWPMPWSAPTPW